MRSQLNKPIENEDFTTDTPPPAASFSLHSQNYSLATSQSVSQSGPVRPSVCPGKQPYQSAACWNRCGRGLCRKTNLSNEGMTDDGTASRRGPVSQRRRCGVHHLPAVTDCWHVVRGRSWGRRKQWREPGGRLFPAQRGGRTGKLRLKLRGRMVEVNEFWELALKRSREVGTKYKYFITVLK